MLNPKITIKHYKRYFSCSNVSGVQVELKHKLSKGILGSVMKYYTRRYDEISTFDTWSEVGFLELFSPSDLL